MTNNNLKISVIIPTLNRPDSLSNCLKSLEEQVVTLHEVIIIVDGELTDEVQNVIDIFKHNGKLDIVQYNNGRAMGVQYSKNKGIDAATGDIIAFIDDDIVVSHDWTIQIQKGYKAYDDVAGVGGMIALQEAYFDNLFYKLYTRVKRYLFRRKIGRLNFIGMAYLELVIPVNSMPVVDFLHGGNMTLRRDVSLKFDTTLVGRDEFDIGIRIRSSKKGKLVYNPKAIAYHHHNPAGGVANWGSKRLYWDFRNHVPFLMKDYNLKYLRLAVFAVAVCGYSIIALKPGYMKAIVDGLALYKTQIRETGNQWAKLT